MFIFDNFPGFQAFSCLCGNPGREASSISRGQGVTVFSWVDLSPQYIVLSTKSADLQTLVMC